MGEALSHANYRVHGKIGRNPSSWTVAMNNNQLILREEELFSESTDGPRKNILLRPEQCSVQWMMDPVSRFNRTGELLLDSYFRTLATGKVCPLLSEHRKFAGCEKDHVSSQDSNWSTVEVHAKPVLIPYCDIDKSKETV